MDFNDITSRLKRVYNAIGKQREYDIASNVKNIFEKSGNQVRVGLIFGNLDEAELNNRVFGIINAIASLKDHLKNKFKELGKNSQNIENMIDNSDNLKLIMDLWNQDKHGYPLTKYKRSNRNPKIVNIGQGLTIAHGNQATVSFTISADTNSVEKISSENSVIIIHGDVVDDKGILITSLDKMIESAVKDIENFIHNNKII